MHEAITPAVIPYDRALRVNPVILSATGPRTGRCVADSAGEIKTTESAAAK
jgi:hypothetical protein